MMAFMRHWPVWLALATVAALFGCAANRTFDQTPQMHYAETVPYDYGAGKKP